MNEDKTRSDMQEVIDLVSADVASIRTGRATPSQVENIEVGVYGGSQKLRIIELATVSSPDPQTLTIEPWDKSIIGEVKKGILEANVGMNPQIDSEIIRISVPPMTTEDRESHVKLLKTKVESGKVMIRQVRGATKKSIDENNLAEDEKHRQEELLQKITDEFVANIEEIGNKKEKDLRQV